MQIQEESRVNFVENKIKTLKTNKQTKNKQKNPTQTQDFNNHQLSILKM